MKFFSLQLKLKTLTVEVETFISAAKTNNETIIAVNYGDAGIWSNFSDLNRQLIAVKGLQTEWELYNMVKNVKRL